jgi:hypothetical protein
MADLCHVEPAQQPPRRAVNRSGLDHRAARNHWLGQTKKLKRSHRIRGQQQCEAQLARVRGTLEDSHAPAGTPQFHACGETTDAGSDDQRQSRISHWRSAPASSDRRSNGRGGRCGATLQRVLSQFRDLPNTFDRRASRFWLSAPVQAADGYENAKWIAPVMMSAANHTRSTLIHACRWRIPNRSVKHPEGTGLVVTVPESVIRIRLHSEHGGHDGIRAVNTARGSDVARAHPSNTHHAAIGV